MNNISSLEEVMDKISKNRDSHDWEIVLSTDGVTARKMRCKVCGYEALKYNVFIPSCKEVQMDEALK